MPQTEMQTGSEIICCPRFDPGAWQSGELVLDERLFLVDRVKSLFHIPLNFGGLMKRSQAKIEAAGAVDPDFLLLCDENSLWGADVYMSITKEVPDAKTVRLSGLYLTKIFEGPYKDIRKWCTQMQEYAKAQGAKLQRMLYYYTTCPKCAKVYGKNYVVLLAELAE